MFRFVSFFIVGFYILPFSLVVKEKYFFEYIQVMVVISNFFFGGFIAWLLVGSNKSVSYEDYLIPKFKFVLLVASLYFFCKLSTLVSVVSHILAGDFFRWALENAVQRYEGTVRLTIWYQLGTIFFLMYSCLLGAYGWKKNSKFLFLVYLLMLIVESAALARAGILIGFCMLFVEFVVRNNKALANMSYVKYFKLAFYSVFCLGGIFFFSAYFRVSHKANVAEILVDKLGVYTLAMYEALFVWMQNTEAYFFGSGYFTFNPIFRALGEETVQGFYPLTETVYGYTNIYTNLRGFLSDFGFSGSSLIFFLSGYKLYMMGKKSCNVVEYFFLKVMLLLILYVLMSPFYFTTAAVACIGSYVYMLLVRENRLINFYEAR